MAYAHCARCNKPLEERECRYLLTHSPNADWLRGMRPDHVKYSLHRNRIIQHPTHVFQILCESCFEKDADSLIRLSVAFPSDHGPGVVVHTRVQSKSDPSKLYEVSIWPYDEPPRMECNCPWGRNVANKDQGETQKWCSHALDALRGLVNDTTSD